MYLKVLFGQHKDPGAAPEALEIVDSFTAEDNGELIDTLFSRHAAKDSLRAVAWFDVSLPPDALKVIQQRLNGAPLIAASAFKAAEGGE